MTQDRGVTIEDLDEIDGLIATPEKETKKPSRKKSGGSSSALSRRLAKMIRLIGNVVEPMDDFDGQLLKENAQEIADALSDLANESDRVRRFLEGSLEGGAWTAVGLLIGGKVVLPVAVHHRMLPETMNNQIAEAMNVPVRKPKKPKATTSVTKPEAIFADDDGEPKMGRVRHPETGDMVLVPLDPATGRPKVDGDGRPIIDE